MMLTIAITHPFDFDDGQYVRDGGLVNHDIHTHVIDDVHHGDVGHDDSYDVDDLVMMMMIVSLLMMLRY